MDLCLRVFPVASLALLGALLGCSDEGGLKETIHDGRALTSVVSEHLERSTSTPPAVLKTAADTPKRDADSEIGLKWTAKPTTLQVFRSTVVHLNLEHAPVGHQGAQCTWKFSDGSPNADGCQVSHTFHGGRADQSVTLVLEDGDWKWESTRSILLDRLEVVDVDTLKGEGAAQGALPARPEPGPTSFRFAVLADTGVVQESNQGVQNAVKTLVETIKPEVVVHLGGQSSSSSNSDELRASIGRVGGPLEREDILTTWGMSPFDRANGLTPPRPSVQLVDGAHYPDHYSFTHKGAFFLVISTQARSGVSEELIRWMRDSLSKASIYESRYVLSYLPLHKFSDEHVGSLDKRFRLYELFLRARVTAVVSAGYRVFFEGRYGALPVISVGALSGEGGKLAGSDFPQQTSLLVVDQIEGRKERAFALEGPHFSTVFDETLLPETVEVYTR